MIIETPFYTDAGLKYGYDLIQDPTRGWQARFGKGILHEDDFVNLTTAIEAMLADAAQIALSNAASIFMDAVKGASTLSGAIEALERQLPPKGQ